MANTPPAPVREPSAVLFPASTEHVRAIVLAANRWRVELYPISTGNNIGLGSAPTSAGQVVVDLGYRMNRILQVNEETCYAELEPGVSFQMLHDELARRGNKLMVSATSGPPHGGIIGNALDRGAGYGPYFDHFGMLCGMEIVLGNGDVIRTGDGGLDTEDPINWHVSRFSSGPALDGLFAQSNFGIVTRVGIWLMPRPPVSRSFHFVFPDDEDIEQIIDLCRPLKLSNFVPSLFRVANDLYALAPEERNPEYMAGSKDGISDAGRAALQRAWLGAWQVSGMFYGPSTPRWSRRSSAYGRISSAAARPASAMRRRRAWRPCAWRSIPWTAAPAPTNWACCSGGPAAATHGSCPARPWWANRRWRSIVWARHLRQARDGLHRHARRVRAIRAGLHVLVWNKDDKNENARADACYRELAETFARHGVGVGRPGGLPRLAHAADDPGTARRLRRHQEGA